MSYCTPGVGTTTLGTSPKIAGESHVGGDKYNFSRMRTCYGMPGIRPSCGMFGPTSHPSGRSTRAPQPRWPGVEFHIEHLLATIASGPTGIGWYRYQITRFENRFVGLGLPGETSQTLPISVASLQRDYTWQLTPVQGPYLCRWVTMPREACCGAAQSVYTQATAHVFR